MQIFEGHVTPVRSEIFLKQLKNGHGVALIDIRFYLFQTDFEWNMSFLVIY